MNPMNAFMYFVFFVALYFEVFMLFTFFENKKRIAKEEAAAPTRFPSVTIIVPAYNEEATIERTVASLLSLDYPKEKLRIIVVDDGSTDGTPQVLERLRSNAQITLVRKKNGGKFTALNEGIGRTGTELVGCLDADSFVLPSALRKIVAYFENPEVMAVTPAIKIHRPDSLARHIQNSEYNLGIFMKKSLGLLNAINVTPGPFSIFRKRVFDTLGPFRHAHNTEDMEIALRMQKNFYKIRNAHEAVVYTVGPKTARTLYRQRVRWVHGFLKNIVDYRELFFDRRYGHLGVFTLPAYVFGVVGSIFAVAMMLANLGRFFYGKIIEWSAVGFHLAGRGFRLEWFFVNTDSKVFLSMTLIFMTLLLITFGRKLSERRMALSLHSLYFPLLYPLFSACWLFKALYNAAFSKKPNWR